MGGMTKAELLMLAASLGIEEVGSRDKKADILTAIEAVKNE